MDRPPALLFGVLLFVGTIDQASAACGTGQGSCRVRGTNPTGFDRPKTFVPVGRDPSPPRSRAGTIDLGGGSEVRIGGRTRVDYNYSR